MNNNIIHITYAHREMTIDMDRFFPTPQKNLHKLITVIRLQWREEGRTEHIRQIKNYLKERIDRAERESDPQKAEKSKVGIRMMKKSLEVLNTEYGEH